MSARRDTGADARIDAIVVSYNSGASLVDCVTPLLGAPGVAVTVVDNASPDDSLSTVAGLPLKTIQTGRNAGFGAGCNAGLAAGSAELVLFLNPDALLEPADLERLVEVLDAEPAVGLVGPRMYDGDGTLIPTVRRAQRSASVWAQALFLHRLFPRARWANEIDARAATYERAGYPEWVSGACMLARRELLERLGGFDEGFFLYCEDMDLCTRLRAAGALIRFEPDATARHQEGGSAERTSLFGVLASSRVRYAGKHNGRLGAWWQRAGITVEALTHVVANARRRPRARGYAAALRAALRPADRPASAS